MRGEEGQIHTLRVDLSRCHFAEEFSFEGVKFIRLCVYGKKPSEALSHLHFDGWIPDDARLEHPLAPTTSIFFSPHRVYGMHTVMVLCKFSVGYLSLVGCSNGCRSVGPKSMYQNYW